MKKGKTNARIRGESVRFIYSDESEEVSGIKIWVGNACLNEHDVNSINHLLEYLKERPTRTLDLRD